MFDMNGRIMNTVVPQSRAPRLFPKLGRMWSEPECTECGKVCAVGAQYDSPEKYIANGRRCGACHHKAVAFMDAAIEKSKPKSIAVAGDRVLCIDNIDASPELTWGAIYEVAEVSPYKSYWLKGSNQGAWYRSDRFDILYKVFAKHICFMKDDVCVTCGKHATDPM